MALPRSHMSKRPLPCSQPFAPRPATNCRERLQLRRGLHRWRRAEPMRLGDVEMKAHAGTADVRIGKFLRFQLVKQD